MKAHDRDQFEKEMEIEIERFTEKESYEIIHRNKVPYGKRILHAVWTFRRKTNPSGLVYRHRSRLCVDGSRTKHILL